jgi:hypothetical protein
MWRFWQATLVGAAQVACAFLFNVVYLAACRLDFLCPAAFYSVHLSSAYHVASEQIRGYSPL